MRDLLLTKNTRIENGGTAVQEYDCENQEDTAEKHCFLGSGLRLLLQEVGHGEEGTSGDHGRAQQRSEVNHFLLVLLFLFILRFFVFRLFRFLLPPACDAASIILSRSPSNELLISYN